MFKVNNKDTEWRYWRRSGVFICFDFINREICIIHELIKEAFLGLLLLFVPCNGVQIRMSWSSSSFCRPVWAQNLVIFDYVRCHLTLVHHCGSSSSVIRCDKQTFITVPIIHLYILLYTFSKFLVMAYDCDT